MPKLLRCFGAGLTAVLFTAAASAQGPPGGTVADQVASAYAKAQQYAATDDVTITTQRGRWTSVDASDIRVAYDRPTQRLRIDTPDFLLIADGRKLRISMPAYPGQYTEVDQPKPLTWATLVAEAPLVQSAASPDLAFMLADNPIELLSEGTAIQATPGVVKPEDEDQRPYLEAQTTAGPLQIRLNPDTQLVEQMTIRVEQPGGDSIELKHAVTITALDEPLPKDTFTFDTTNAQKVLAITPHGSPHGNAGPGAGNANSGGAGGGHPLIGKRAPQFTVKTLAGEDWSLKDAEADIIVLGFWASWAPSATPYVNALQKVHADHKPEGDDPVTLLVLGMNCGEKPDDIAPAWEKAKLDIPCLLDDFSVSDAYLMQVLPHTVIIAEGVVRYIHSGPEDDYAALIQKQIDTLTEQIAERRAEMKAAEESPTDEEAAATDPPTE